MKIRTTSIEDLEPLAEAYVAAFHEVDPSEKWSVERARELLAFLFGCQPDLAFLVEVDGRVGGGISGLVKPWWDGNHLVQTELFVAPWCQHKGSGRDLFRYFLEAAVRTYNAVLIESLTFRDEEFPLSWYRKLGFEEKSEWQVIFGDVALVLKGLKEGGTE